MKLLGAGRYDGRMLTDTRHRATLRQLRQHGDVSVQVPADELGVSPSAIRRDLATLSSDGLLRRVRGGGSPVEQGLDSFDVVDRRSADDKDAVADRAAPEEVDVLVTNRGADPGTLARMAEAGTEVIQA